MFEKIIEDFYKSLAGSIRNRKKQLKISRDEILNDPKRVSNITQAIRNNHHPYLIGKSEYAYLYYLYLFEDKDSFLKECILDTKVDVHIKKNGTNYDRMLWGHIDWDKMFKDTITELSGLDFSEGFGNLFESTLIDYVPYAVIKYDGLHPEYGKEYVFPEERERERQNAVCWVHLRHGSELFRKSFLERFEGKTLSGFDEKFREFVEDYLEKRKPNPYSLGLQAYSFHKNISGFAAYWQSFVEVQYSDMYDEKSKIVKLLDEYLENGRKQIQEFKKYQQYFDDFNVDIK